MPGLALTNDFLLNTATVMIGAPTELKQLNPTAHSVGLVKNLKITGDPKLIELTEGVLNDVVATTKVSLGLKVAWEMWEYTSKNLAYANGLDPTSGTYAAKAAAYSVSANASSAASSIHISGDHTSTLTAGTWITIYESTDDLIHVAKVASSAFGSDTAITLTAGYELPFAVTAAAGKVGLANKIDVGLDNSDNFFSMKVVSFFSAGQIPLVLAFPKVKLTKGFDLTFTTDNYANMPFEATIYRPVPGDSFYDTDFKVSVSVLRR